MALLERMGAHFGTLIRNLVLGNARKAARMADKALKDNPGMTTGVMAQDLIEKLAQDQALKNGLLNLPSLFPGIGTIISFWLLGAENFLIIDQSVTVSLGLLRLHGHDLDEGNRLDFVLQVIGEAYELIDENDIPGAQAITQRYFTRELPQKYLNLGLDRILARMFPYRRTFRLLPVIGVIISAYDGYKTIANVGRVTLKQIRTLDRL